MNDRSADRRSAPGPPRFAGRADLRGDRSAQPQSEGKSNLTSKVWAQALDDNDPLATKLFDTAIETVGIAVGSDVNLLDIDTIVLGRGLAVMISTRSW